MVQTHRPQVELAVGRWGRAVSSLALVLQDDGAVSVVRLKTLGIAATLEASAGRVVRFAVDPPSAPQIDGPASSRGASHPVLSILLFFTCGSDIQFHCWAEEKLPYVRVII